LTTLTPPTTYIAAKLDASDDYLGFGARWLYYDYDSGFKIAKVPAEHAEWLEKRLRSGLDLVALSPQQMLEAAIKAADDLPGPNEPQVGVD
jgi:hypothetical protein